METTGRSSGARKGGKHVKSLTAEEEARRREVVKEKLREKLELERRALKVVERLLEDSVTEDFLVDCAKFITPANYKDVVEERSIVKLCGYPICPNKLGKVPTQQYKISTKTNKVYDITERKCFCSNFCYKASRGFELQISKAPLWLRQHESPTEIKLMKKGDGGSSGEEVFLVERPLQREDIERPLVAQPAEPHSSQQPCPEGSLSHSDSSDLEQEHDFVTSVVCQQQRPRVHWGDLPKCKEDDMNGIQGKMQRLKKQPGEPGDREKKEQKKSHDAEKNRELINHERKEIHACETEITADFRQLHRIDTALKLPEEKDTPEGPCVEDATAKMNMCSLSQTVGHTVSLPVSAHQSAEDTTPFSSAPIDSKPSVQNKHLSSSTINTADENSRIATMSTEPVLTITQVGMSKRGAAGLRNLLKDHTSAPTPESIRLNLLNTLRKTLREWSTDETRKFLYGADHSLTAPCSDVCKEELDEDDLEDEVTMESCVGADAEVTKRPSAAAPDLETLKKETQQQELRVREFYKGTWNLPEDTQTPYGKQVTVQEHGAKDKVLPLIDSNAQHLIQKRIAVEKLTNCLRNIVGPLRLTMTDVSTDLNNLVRTFRFTNTNIIHKTPEWTLIALVLLHLSWTVPCCSRLSTHRRLMALSPPDCPSPDP
ncbi:putative RNA polymerase II subunit B1 CTD phosphatase rpap2 isoform X2 [Echeneis naucrates]|uniref:putative RNA polymerase II subunit B1 CTD phosphatase rpap2 isoform X2 n=1 Tax=Echeneis naucrates TaxID=173247 RepID=UPI001113E62A|nr:putative RNA polymerase II subunit B1 CTD phosphatase RPAP2 isoform X2 [Echeneis naucrates]